GAVIVAQVAVARAGAEVDPLADVAVSQKAVVILVAVALENAAFDLAADAARRPQRGAGTDLGPVHLRVRPDVARPFQAAEGVDHGLAIDHDRSPRRVGQRVRLDAGRRVHQQGLRRTHHRQTVRAPRWGARRPGVPEILTKLLAVVLDQLPEVGEERAA